MSFDPRDYDGVTFESEHGYDEASLEEEAVRAELRAQEDEIERARELNFRDTPFCEDACYDTMIHTPACMAVNDPVKRCTDGIHNYRLIRQGDNEDECEYRCTDCGSTDPEGDNLIMTAVKRWRRSQEIAIRESEAA